jgi:hypothetical protein
MNLKIKKFIKENYNLKLFLIFNFIFLLLGLLTLKKYPGENIIYIFFCFVSIFFLNFLLRKNSFFFEKYLSIFFFFSYWFNFSFKISFYELFPFSKTRYFPEGVGNFDFKGNSYDETLIVVSLSFISFSIFSYLRAFFFRGNYNLKKFTKYNNHKILNNLFYIYIFFLFLIFLINLKFNFYYRGSVGPYNDNIFYNFFLNFIKWFYNIGAFVILCHFLSINFSTNKNIIFSFLILLIIDFLLNFSILSRNLILNSSIIIFTIYLYNFKNKKMFIQLAVIVLFLLFLINSILVSNLRSQKFHLNVNKEINNNITLSQYNTNSKFEVNFSKFYKEIFSRLVGIEGVLAIQSVDNKSFKLLKQSFDKNKHEYFFDELKNDKRDNGDFKSITVPGLIAFLYYSGSYIFIFISCGLLLFLFCASEFFLLKLLKNSTIVISFISYLVTYRLLHFGHKPIESYKFILGIILSIIIVKFIEFYYKKNS